MNTHMEPVKNSLCVTVIPLNFDRSFIKRKYVLVILGGLLVAGLIAVVTRNAQNNDLVWVGSYPFGNNNTVRVAYDPSSVVRANDSVKAEVGVRFEKPYTLPKVGNVRGYGTTFVADCSNGKTAMHKLDYYDDFGERIYASALENFRVTPLAGQARRDLLSSLCPNFK